MLLQVPGRFGGKIMYVRAIARPYRAIARTYRAMARTYRAMARTIARIALRR